MVLNDKSKADKALNEAKKLRNAKEPRLRKIRIEADLTKGQRSNESDLYDQCMQKNLNRSQELIDKGQAFRVVGKKGRKWITEVTLKDKEMVTAEGKIVWLAVDQPGTERGEIRRRSAGSTPEAVRKLKLTQGEESEEEKESETEDED